MAFYNEKYSKACRLWAEVRIPFMFLLAIAISVGLLIWTNIRDFRVPKY